MAVKNNSFQPGAVLHEVIVGAFRAAGTTFDAWCKESGIHPSTARMATYGQSGGDKGQALLTQIIDAAGRDVVELSYSNRVLAEARKLTEDAA